MLRLGDAYIDGLVQDCSNSIANALELLQSCTKPSIYALVSWVIFVQVMACNKVDPLWGQATTWYNAYRQVSNIRRTLVGNRIVDNSDVVGASPVGAAPTTSSLST